MISFAKSRRINHSAMAVAIDDISLNSHPRLALTVDRMAIGLTSCVRYRNCRNSGDIRNGIRTRTAMMMMIVMVFGRWAPNTELLLRNWSSAVRSFSIRDLVRTTARAFALLVSESLRIVFGRKFTSKKS